MVRRLSVLGGALAISAALSAGMCVAAGAAGALPTRQQAAVVEPGIAGARSLVLATVPVLSPGPGQVLIRVYAASVNAADWRQLERASPAAAAERRIPGLDVAGVVAAVGPRVTDRPIGMPVFAMVGPVREGPNGAYAHYVIASSTNTAPKPARLSYAEASGLGVAGVTALRALDEGSVQSGDRVLITGIAGGVGSTAAQIAIARGATVVGTASPNHAAYLRGLGVSGVVDYHDANFGQKVGRPDVVLDTVGGSEALQAFHALAPGGHFVSIARAPVGDADCAAAHVHCAGSPGHAADAPLAVLLRVGRLAEAGRLSVHIDRSFPLSQVREALQYAGRGHVEGKVVLAVTPQARER
jgi:NADPH:quinone reductase-like Zn-dependent oxidoreductase